MKKILLQLSMIFMGCVVGGILGLGGGFYHLLSPNGCLFAWWIHPLAIVVGVVYCFFVDKRFFAGRYGGTMDYQAL